MLVRYQRESPLLNEVGGRRSDNGMGNDWNEGAKQGGSAAPPPAFPLLSFAQIRPIREDSRSETKDKML